MPIKKSKSDILYTERIESSTSSHPIHLGCDDVLLPLSFLRKDGSLNYSTTKVSIYTKLNPKIHGSNVHKIIDILNNNKKTTEDLIDFIIKSGYEHINDSNVCIILDFDYFLKKKAFVSGKEAYISYPTQLKVDKNDDKVQYFLRVKVPYASLCPTSKEISDYGAHNQRCLAEIDLELTSFSSKKDFWVEDVVELVDKSVSCPVFNSSCLEDEAYQTELMYENPLFIEDIAIKLSNNLQKHIEKDIKTYKISLSHRESINNYTIKSFLEYKK